MWTDSNEAHINMDFETQSGGTVFQACNNVGGILKCEWFYLAFRRFGTVDEEIVFGHWTMVVKVQMSVRLFIGSLVSDLSGRKPIGKVFISVLTSFSHPSSR